MFVIDSNINWKQLKKQKLTLLEIIAKFEGEGNTNISEDLEGILNLIDNVQDNAVKSGKWTEEEIFNLSEE